MRCAMTGIPISDPSDGIWDDGEWISWEWINGQLHEQDLKAEFPNAPIEIIKVFKFESRMIDRKKLGKGKGKNASYSWGSESE